MAESAEADAVLIPGGQIPAAQLVASLEADLGVPVIAQNHSDFWEPLRALGIDDVAAGHGRLLDSLRDNGPLSAIRKDPWLKGLPLGRDFPQQIFS